MSDRKSVVANWIRGKVIYLAGPYTIDSVGCTKMHLEAATKLLRKGIKFFSPILHGHFLCDEASMNHDSWVDFDIAILRRCDGVVRLPGVSLGSDMEVAEAVRIGLPVWLGTDPVASLIRGDLPMIPGDGARDQSYQQEDPQATVRRLRS